jgi:hypothetical protein
MPKRIGAPDAGTDPLRNLHDHLITDLRTQGTVHTLKLVESDVKHHKIFALAGCSLEEPG